MNRTLTSAIMLLAGLGCMAGAPQGYYDSCRGKSRSALKTQLYNLVKNHTAISYGSGAGETWTAFSTTDIHPGGYWWDIYTDAQVSASTLAPSSMNIEHTFPKSWWGGTKNNAYKDICHLMPVNANANNLRSNYPYGEVGVPKSYKQSIPSPRFTYGTPVSGQGGGAAYVFEPDDEYKGDVARNYFYMVTCYQDLTWSAGGLQTAAQNLWPTLQPWAQEMLLRWHRLDPVSQKERDRNDGIYEVQGNRNPFIDHPEMVEHIWGNAQDTGWDTGEGPVEPGPDPITSDPGISAPLQEDLFQLPPCAPDETVQIEIAVAGENLTRSITARISDENGFFSFAVGKNSYPALTITATAAMNADGYALKVRYTPAVAGSHRATVTLESAEISEPVTLYVQGECRAPQAIEAVTALEPEILSETSYRAKWLPLAAVPDSYTVVRTLHPEGEDPYSMEYEVEPTENTLLFDDRDPSVAESYKVYATVEGKDGEPGNEVTLAPSTGIGEVKATPRTVRYFTLQGIELPGIPTAPGTYMAVTPDQTYKFVKP